MSRFNLIQKLRPIIISMIAEHRANDYPDSEDLLKWVNKTMRLNLRDLTELKNGAIFCQVIDAIYEGKADLESVVWTANTDAEVQANYSVLTQLIERFQIKQTPKIELLSSGNYETIYKFTKWLRMFSGSSRDFGLNYNAKARRGSDKSDSITDRIPIPGVTLDFDAKTIQKLAQFDLMKSERDFYFSKLRNIDHFLDVYKDASLEALVQGIKEILYLPPDRISMITDEGKVLVKEKEDDQFDQKENINANFLDEDIDGDEDEANGGFHFETGELNLLSDKNDLEC